MERGRNLIIVALAILAAVIVIIAGLMKEMSIRESGPSLVHGTIIVAASDTLDKSGADYICDGFDDQVEILAAIATWSNYEPIMLLPGTYNITGPLTPTEREVKSKEHD
jgi:hypothetical protein